MLDSVLFQTKKVNEIILVNDASTDNSYQIVEYYINNNKTHIFKHILLEHKKEQAITKNAEAITSISSHIAFLDSDDAWNREKN